MVALAGWIALPAPAAEEAREVHGSSDAYAEAGIALAWGVRRGSDDATTAVTLRILADPVRYPRVEVTGRDPFTQAQRVLLAATATRGLPDLVVPRAHFADFPRTELRFHAPESATGRPVVVYYLGVPDTTPEFAAAPALDQYLTDRIARARAGAVETP